MEGHSALACAELEEGHESFNNDNPWDDVSDAVVTESQSTSVQQPHLKVPAVLSIQVPGKRNTRSSLFSFSSKGRSAMLTSVVRGCLEEVLSQVVGADGLDVYAVMSGKILYLCSTLLDCGITDGCTVHVHYRLRGGSREDVPAQWTCSQRFAPRCWPVRERCYGCGAAREDLPVSSKGKGNGKGDIAVGPLGRKPPPTAPTTRKPQVVPPRGPPRAGFGSPPTLETPPLPSSEELVKALQLLQSVLTPEDFSKYEK